MTPLITPITSPSLTLDFRGNFGASESESCSASPSETSSTLSEGISSVASPAPSRLESALTTKLGLAIRGVQRHEIGVEGTLEINATLRGEEEGGGKVSLGANRACCSTISESVRRLRKFKR